MAASGFSDHAFARLAELAQLLAGLVFPPNRQPSAQAGMRRAMASLRISDPEILLRAAEQPGEARDVFLAELTVGESYFFRDSAQLELLATEIIPERRESHGVTRPLRLWSAGCASGEEPYTISIMLQELGWDGPAQILGTDIALPRLKAAQHGRYTRWALRGVSEQRIERWFRRNGTYFDLDPAVRESVEFRALNLVHDNYPESGPFDLVLCRNVMIYFDLPTVARIATSLLHSLDSEGWLVLGASDPPLARLVPCEAVMTPSGMAYRRPGRPSVRPLRAVFTGIDVAHVPEKYVAPVLDPAPPAPLHVIVADARQRENISVPVVPRGDREHDEIISAYERADYAAAESMLVIALAAPGEEEDTLWLWILYIRTVANQGRLNEAGEHCARALEFHPLAAELQYLHATLLSQANWHTDAAIAARRAIYLDRKFVMGHLQLGDALTRVHDSKGARIAFENVIALLADVDPVTPIMAADGIPASRLRQIATFRLRKLQSDASR